jgi:transposase-like protein
MNIKCPYCKKTYHYFLNGDAQRILAEQKLKRHIMIMHPLEK